MQMQSLRRFRKLVVLPALAWLPMSVFAQVCATHAMVAHMGGPQHPALVAPEDMGRVDSGLAQPALAVVDAATLWQPVDDYDSGCAMKAMCAFASMSALVSSSHHVHVTDDLLVPLAGEIAFSTRELSPDTPPPRR